MGGTTEPKYTVEEAFVLYPYLRMLYEAVRTLPENALVVELGSATGKSMATMLMGGKKGDTFVAVDHFGGSRNVVEAPAFEFWDKQVKEWGFKDMKHVFLDNVQRAPTEAKLYLLEEAFDSAATKFGPETIDMIFLDGDHMQTFHDLLVWTQRLKRGGRMFCHDVDTLHFTVAEEFYVFCEHFGYEWNMDGELGCFTK